MASIHGELDLGFLMDFPLPRLRFRFGRLGSTRTRSRPEDFFFGIIRSLSNRQASFNHQLLSAATIRSEAADCFAAPPFRFG
jgi:hypothetical protein